MAPYVYPFRLRVLRALSAWLGGISISEGFATDLPSTSVFRGRATFGESDPLPMVSILEAPDEVEQYLAAEGGDSTGAWNLLIQGFVQDDKDNPTDPAHILMADVKKRLGQLRRANSTADALEVAGGGNGVVNFRIGAGVVRPPDDVSAKAYFWLPLTLVLAEDVTKPYDD